MLKLSLRTFASEFLWNAISLVGTDDYIHYIKYMMVTNMYYTSIICLLKHYMITLVKFSAYPSAVHSIAH